MATFYHNPTKQVYNETDLSDFLDKYNPGDTVLTTKSGSSLVHQVSQDVIDSWLQVNEIEE